MLRQRHLTQGLISSLNENANAYTQEETTQEIERVYFAKLSDFEQLDSAGESEHHEQWEYRLFGEDAKPIGTLRSRSIDQGDRYEMTIKVYRKDGAGSNESTLGSTKDVHECIASLADRVLRKIRYVLPVVIQRGEESLELKWEIDVFLTPQGEFEPWVKVDFEIPDESIEAPAFPLKAEQIIDASFDRRLSEGEREIVDALFARVRSAR